MHVRCVWDWYFAQTSSAIKQVPTSYSAPPIYLFLSPLSHPTSFSLPELDCRLKVSEKNVYLRRLLEEIACEVPDKLYFSTHIIKAIRSRSIRWARHEHACQLWGNSRKILVDNRQGNRLLGMEVLGMDMELC
jgi:hypothetical protein